MNILVYNVAAEYAGALTVLKQFHNEVISNKDKSHTWYFVVSTDVLEESDNVKVIRVPWVKKSWLHRLWYDKFCAKKLVQQYEIDLVFSMQNMPIEGVRCPQIVYLHQSLQFSPMDYSFWKKEERIFWIRKNIICNIMKKRLKYADSIIVQTRWMKEATQEWLKDHQKKIEVLPPRIECKYIIENVEREAELFIYPAGDGIHKNHKLIIKACDILNAKGIAYNVLFTMDINESKYANELYLEVKKKGLNICFVGLLDGKEIMRLYQKATLIFPSYIETFGLPLLEAKSVNGVVLCSDLPFAREILKDYENAYFFDTMDEKQLADYMEKCSAGFIKPHTHANIDATKDIPENKTLVEYILEQERRC